MRTPLNNRFDRRGFSLVELVLVLAIMAIVSALAVPRYYSSVARYRADAAARRIASDLELAQSRAYSRNATQSALFSIGSSSYQIDGMADPYHPSQPYTVRLGESPYFARLKSVNFAGSNTLSFDGYGQPASAGTIVLAVGMEQRTITIELSSGRSRIQ
jgi:prepilin-type N-terminal cleavage/methylation domain-containing protein